MADRYFSIQELYGGTYNKGGVWGHCDSHGFCNSKDYHLIGRFQTVILHDDGTHEHFYDESLCKDHAKPYLEDPMTKWPFDCRIIDIPDYIDKNQYRCVNNGKIFEVA